MPGFPYVGDVAMIAALWPKSPCGKARGELEHALLAAPRLPSKGSLRLERLGRGPGLGQADGRGRLGHAEKAVAPVAGRGGLAGNGASPRRRACSRGKPRRWT